MNARLLGLSQRVREGFALPGSGTVVVFRQQMRGRCAWRDLIWTGVILLAHLAIAAGLQTALMPNMEYTGEVPRFLMRWLTMGAVSAAFLYLPCAAVMGAGAVPPVEKFEATQSALLTRLTPLNLCMGRLFAALWPLLSALMASCAFWLAAQVAWRFVHGPLDGSGPIFLAHLVLLCAVYMVGAIGFLFALRRRPGRAWGRGAGIAGILTALLLSGLLLLNPLIRKMSDPTQVINSALLVNPAIATAAAFKMDTLRLKWLYEHTDAPEYPFSYPEPQMSAALFAGMGLLAQGLSAALLRRAYR